jgi:hypothetical protein
VVTLPVEQGWASDTNLREDKAIALTKVR